MKIHYLECKTALSTSKLPGLDYSLNPYVGCEHNCAYCYAPNVLRINRNYWGEFVKIKENIPLILSRELKKKKKGVVGISTVTDPYQPVERKYKLTRYCLEQLLIHDFPVHIQTKSSLVERDFDILSNFSHSEVMISVGTLNDSERKLLEPGSSSISERLVTLERCVNANLKTCVFFGPIFPTVDEHGIIEILDVFVNIGVSEIMIDSFHFKPGIYENIKCVLKNHPVLLDYFSTYQLDDSILLSGRMEQIMKDYCKKVGINIVSAF